MHKTKRKDMYKTMILPCHIQKNRDFIDISYGKCYYFTKLLN